ncbi:hypothetical protein ACWKWK_12995 [Pseudoxanthomonas beigongshangi]
MVVSCATDSESLPAPTWLLPPKLVATAGVGWALWHAFQVAPEGRGIFGEIVLLGPHGALVAAMLFLVVVFFYCRDLGRALAAVSLAARKARPASVWWMFVLPYNFIEDFSSPTVSASLRAEARGNAVLADWRCFGEWFPSRPLFVWPMHVERVNEGSAAGGFSRRRCFRRECAARGRTRPGSFRWFRCG